MDNIPLELRIKSDTEIEYTDAEYEDYKYTFEDVIVAAKRIKHSRGNKLGFELEELTRIHFKKVMEANDNRKLNLPEFNYFLNTLVRTPK